MTLVMPLSDEDTDGDEDFRETHSFNFFEKMMNLDREVILFAVLLTSYAAVRNMNQTATKTSQPKPFFSENPWVNDFYHGEIHKAFGLASKEDITFVMYYAPWDVDCQRAKPIFEKVARYYHKQIHFMAINCWEPSSVCKAHFSKIKRYPVFMVYLQRSKGVEYHGLIDFAHMTHFLSSIITPLHRVHDLQTLNNLRSTYDAVVLAYIPFYGMFGGDHYHMYYRAALKFLEVDPRRDVVFALMTDQIAVENTFFSSDRSARPTLKLYLWNSTLMFDGSWDPPTIVKWVHESTHKIATWVYPPGTKSNLLAQFINSGPTLILFTPRNMFLSHSYEYNLLKLAALHFYDCYSETAYEDFYTTMFSLLFFISSDDQWDSMDSLKYKCSTSLLKRDSTTSSKWSKWIHTSQKHSYHHSDFDALSNNSSFYDSCGNKFNTYISSRSSRFFDFESNDELSAESLLRFKLKSDCRKLRFALKYLPEDWMNNKEFHSVRRQPLARNLGCKGNTTLSFLAMDSLHFEHFASNLGMNLNDKYAQAAVFIVDSKAEAIYHLNSTYLSLGSLEQFIHNFTYRNLTRLLRSSDTSPNTEETLYNSLIETASSNTFNDLVISNSKTVLVYFYSPYCTYSQAVYYIYISLANTLKSLDKYISFVRIDGENNDLEWPFFIDKYPSIILFPSADKSNSKLFSRRSKITVSNLSKFILFNLSFELRAQAHILFCLNSIFSDFHSIDGCINNFKLSSLYFISHYNIQLRNILIHYKLENYQFQNITNSSSMHTKEKFSVLNEKTHAESKQNLIINVHKIKCKLLYFRLINSYLNNFNFSNTNIGSVSGTIHSFYQIYLKDLNDIHHLNSISCVKLLNTLKSLQNNDIDDQETVSNFQKSKIQYRETFESILCHLRKRRASKCENPNNLINPDEINLNEHSHLITNDFPFDDEKEEEILLSSDQIQKNEELSTNKILNTPSGDNHEEQNSRGNAILDEL